MKKLHLFTFVVLGMLRFSNVLAQDLETLLFELSDVIFEKIEAPDGYKATYELRIKQPLDHSDPAKGFFYQRAFLSHKGYEHPTVIVTEGYTNTRNRIYELTELLDANQISVEHRYFGKSMPDSMDYNYLNLEQATADLHHINQLFRKIYNGKWISTGISKGGATTIFYRYFYPDDVDVSVPYVAPINIAFEEPRIYEFLDTIGTEDCRNKITAFQKRILENREEVLPLLKYYSKGANAKYSYFTIEEAFEYTVLKYPFSFWQYGHSCSEIPDASTSLEDALDYLLGVSEITFFSDKLIAKYGSHYFQSAEEMGYYGYETKDFKGLLKALPLSPNPHAAFVPEKMPVKFDDTLLKEVNKWLKKNGNQFIYIYGGIDTWSASAVQPNNNVDAEWFFLEGKHHANARIRSMNEKEKQLLITTLERWLFIEIKNTNMFGLRTVVYKVENMKEAKDWYSNAFQTNPYFDEPFYIGFNIGGYELGLQPQENQSIAKTNNVVTYFGVNEIEKEFKRLLTLGATVIDEPENVGGDIIVATVRDPWGNAIGLIYNPDFKIEE